MMTTQRRAGLQAGAAIVLGFGVLSTGACIGTEPSADVLRSPGRAATPTQGLATEEIEGIANYTLVDATVGCAGATSPDAMPELKRRGFASVVNLRLGSENNARVEESRAAAQATGLRYLHLPFDGTQPDPAVVDRFLDAVADAENQPAFIHCGSANRVGAMWMIKRVVQDGWPIPRAQEEAEAIGLRSAGLRAFALDYLRQRGHS